MTIYMHNFKNNFRKKNYLNKKEQFSNFNVFYFQNKRKIV